MDNLPLFENLMSKVQNKDLTVKQKTAFLEKISLINDNGKELFYVLIYLYAQKNKLDTKSLFKPVIDNVDESRVNLTWSIGSFPIELRQLLFLFLNMHILSQTEDIERLNTNI
jgi:hypothetical protein